MALADASRLVVTTFDAAGSPLASSEWVVPAGDRGVGFWTPDATAWTQRLAASPVVTLRAANALGVVDREAPLLEGRAEVVGEGVLLAEVRAATRAKYGLRATAAGVIDRVREFGGAATPEGAVVIDVVG